jgi:hypothetical protein
MHCRHQTDNDNSQRARHAGGGTLGKSKRSSAVSAWFRVPRRSGSFVADMPARESSPQHRPMVGQLALLSALRARSSDNSSPVRSPPILATAQRCRLHGRLCLDATVRRSATWRASRGLCPSRASGRDGRAVHGWG